MAGSICDGSRSIRSASETGDLFLGDYKFLIDDHKEESMNKGKFGQALAVVLFLAVIAIPVSNAGKKPVAFELKTVDGEAYRLEDDLGKSVIILDFWATWCKPCLRELPHINKIYEQYKDQNLKVYAISIDTPASKSQIKPTISRYNFTFPILLDPDNTVIRNYSPARNVPYLVVIGASGEIVREFSGYKPGDENIVESIVKEELAKLKTN